MEVPHGYKQTSIGVIPEDWEISRLAEICSTFRSGNSITSENIFAEGDFPVFGGNGFRGYTNSFTHSGEYILIGRQGALCGNIKYIQGDNYISEHAIAVQPNQDHFLKFWYYKLDFMKLNRLSESSAQPGLSVEKLGRIRIPLPSLPEQQKIAEILFTWDTAIETCQKTIEQLKQRNKGLAQQLLSGKKRLGNFNGHWHFFKLKDIAKRVTAKNEELNDTVVTISAQRGFVLQEDYFSKRVASATLSHYTLLRKGQFAYNKSYSKGYPMGAFKRLDDFEKAVVTTLYICFEIKENVNSDFINFYFEHGFMINGIMQIAQEGARAHGLLNIALEDFFNLDVKIPVLEEQKAIVDILNNASNELRLYQEKLNHLQQQKKGLMQQLLTGKIRVQL